MSVFRASNTPDTDWAVPAQRAPYPPQSAGDDPTEPLYAPDDEPEPRAEPLLDGRRGVILALVVASLALAWAGGATVIALRALDRAERAGSTMVMQLPAAAPTPAPTPSPAAPAPAVRKSGPALLYAQEPVQIRAACGSATLIDLDRQVRIDAPEQESDLRYDNRCRTEGALLSIGPGGRAGSHVSDPDSDRPECAAAVRTGPLDPGELVPVQKGTVLCVATATSLALVEVTGTGADGTASVRVTAWTPPPPETTPTVDPAEAAESVVPSNGTTPGE